VIGQALKEYQWYNWGLCPEIWETWSH